MHSSDLQIQSEEEDDNQGYNLTSKKSPGSPFSLEESPLNLLDVESNSHKQETRHNTGYVRYT